MILGIETATAAGDVALLEGDSVRASLGIERGSQRHAAGLLLAIDALLARESVALERVEGIALSVGPGAFTSLRIGLSTALGLCFGTGRWIAPVPTLAALASRADSSVPIVPLLDARKGQVYAGVYAPDGTQLTPDRVEAPRSFLESLQGPAYCVVGPGVSACRDEIAAILGVRAELREYAPDAASVARLGARMAKAGEVRAPGDVELRYLRAPDLGPA